MVRLPAYDLVRQLETGSRLTPIFNVLEYVLLLASGALILLFTGLTLADVVTREIGTPIDWAQEVSMLGFVWATFLGGAAAFRTDGHYEMISYSPKKSFDRWRVIKSVQNAILAVVMLVLLIAGSYAVKDAGKSHVPVTGISVSMYVAALPVSGAIILLFIAEKFNDLWGRRVGYYRLSGDDGVADHSAELYGA